MFFIYINLKRSGGFFNIIFYGEDNLQNVENFSYKNKEIW